MSLSKEQIGRIDQFLKNQQVRHIDLRLELVDHIATSIESNQTPSNYEAAILLLPKVYYVEYLNTIKAKKELALDQFWKHKLKTFWKSYVTVPMVFITITLILFLTIAGQTVTVWQDNNVLRMISIVVSLTGLVLCIAKLSKALFYKSLLFENALYASVLLFFVGGEGLIQLTTLNGNFEGHWFSSLLGASIVAFQIITLVGLFTEFPKFISTQMRMTYK